MNPDYTTPDTSDRKVLLKWALIALGAVILLFIIVGWLLSASTTERSLSKTPFTAQGYSQLIGSDIYSFNGLAFTKTNINSHETTVLSKGVKLPQPISVYWAGSRGALMNFNESFILTQVEDQLRASGQEVDDINAQYTWFFDFSDNSLHKVSDQSVIPDLAFYSEKDRGFYYIPNPGESEGGDVFIDATYPLHFYNTETKRDTVVAKEQKFADVTYLGACADQKYVACLIGRTDDALTKPRLYGISQDSSKTMLLESTGRLVATNSPNLYITTDQPPIETSSEEDSDYTDAPAVLHNLKDGATTDLGFELAGQTIFPYITASDDYFVLMANERGGGDVQYVSSGKTKLGTQSAKHLKLAYGDGKEFGSSFRSGVSYGDKGAVYVADIDGNQLLFRSNDQQKEFGRLEQKTAKSVVETCVKSTADSSEFTEETSTFQIFFMGEDNLGPEFRAFGDCVEKANKQAFLGYTFKLSARSQFNGRIITD